MHHDEQGAFAANEVDEKLKKGVDGETLQLKSAQRPDSRQELGVTSYISRRGSIQKAALRETRLVQDAAEYMGTLISGMRANRSRGSGKKSLHEQYSYNISLEQGLSVILGLKPYGEGGQEGGGKSGDTSKDDDNVTQASSSAAACRLL